MTNPTPTSVARPPGRIWYAVVLAVAIGGWIGMGTVIYGALGSITDRMVRLVVPGQAEFRLERPGTYTIFHESRSIVDGRVYDLATLSGLQVLVRFRGSALELRRPFARSRYSLGSYSGRSLFQFEVSEPGFYQVSGVYGDGRKTPETVLAIDQGFVGTVTATVFKALAFGLGGMGLAIAILTVVIVRRRRALVASAPRR
jgi:hypothetical protein